MENIIIYDKRRYLFNFIKSKYRSKFCFIKHVDLKDSNIENFENIFLIIFVAYDSYDILAFLNYYSMTNKIIVFTNNPILIENYKKIKHIDFLNTNTLKSKITEFIEFKIKSLNKELE